MYALYAGDFDTAAKEAKTILSENSKFDQHCALSHAELGVGITKRPRKTT